MTSNLLVARITLVTISQGTLPLQGGTLRRLSVKKLDMIDGQGLKAALAAATRCLQRYSESINALNVFPVPDGDTGTNMLLTMQSVDERVQALETNTLSTVAQEAARGALFGARGNSGVIFSQFLAGFAKGLVDVESCNPPSLVKALALGSEASYSAVSEPVEGTMLTVIREFSESAKAFADGDEPDVIDLWTEALNGGREALEKLLPCSRCLETQASLTPEARALWSSWKASFVLSWTKIQTTSI